MKYNRETSLTPYSFSDFEETEFTGDQLFAFLSSMMSWVFVFLAVMLATLYIPMKVAFVLFASLFFAFVFYVALRYISSVSLPSPSALYQYAFCISVYMFTLNVILGMISLVFGLYFPPMAEGVIMGVMFVFNCILEVPEEEKGEFLQDVLESIENKKK